MSNTHTTAVFGLGSMGLGIASNLVKAGHTTYGFDVAEAQVAKFVEQGGQQAEFANIANNLDSVVIVVINAEQTQDVLFGAGGIAAQLTKGTVIVSCATVAPDFARAMGKQCSELGLHYLDAPISGGAVKAASGELSVMAAGSSDAFTAAKPVLDAIAAKVFTIGDAPGAGSAMKAVNQLLAGTQIVTMAEAMAFGVTQGVPPAQFLEVISKCAGTSWILENRAPHVVDGDYSPKSAITIWPKDLGIVLEIAKEAGIDTPMTQAALAQYQQAVDAGLGNEDDAAVTKVYAKQAGINLPQGD